MAGTSSRGNPKLSDIVRSVLVLGIGVLGIFFVAQSIFGNTPDTPDVPAVDYETVLVGVQREAAYPVMAPATLPQGWKATSARYRDEVWSLGVLTDDVKFVGVTQAPGDQEDRVVAEFAEDSVQDGTAEIEGVTWTRWTHEQDTTYSRVVEPEQDGQETTVVLVTSDLANTAALERYVASLSSS